MVRCSTDEISDIVKADDVSNTSMLRKPKSSEERGGNQDDNPQGREPLERRASRVGRKRARSEQKVRREAACSGSSKERLLLPRTAGQATWNWERGAGKLNLPVIKGSDLSLSRD